MKVLCIGSKCFAATLLKKLRHEGTLEEIHTPINNVDVMGGFSDCHKYFDGTFERELLSDYVKFSYKFRPDIRSHHHFYTESYHFPHLDLFNNSSFDKIRMRYEETKQFIDNPTDDYFYFVTLHSSDMDLSVEEIKNEIDKLSKYIDTDRIIYIGSIPYIGAEKNIKGCPVTNIKYSFVNDNFRKVVGDRYIEIYPSNCYDVASEELLNKVKVLIQKYIAE